MPDSRARELFVSLGPERYRVERPWGDLSGHPGTVSDVAVDSRDHVFVLLRTDPLVDAPAAPVVELAPDGSVLAAWPAGAIADAHKMRMAKDDTLWIVDRDAHFVGHFNRDGQLLGGLGARHMPGHPFQHPTDVAFAANGDILVADGYGNSRVHHFAADGTLLASWGEPGCLPGQLSAPHAVCATTDDSVMVADRDNDRLQLYDPKGELLAVTDGYCRPTAICPRPDGLLLVLDQTPRLSLTDGRGDLKGRCRPVLNGAHGVCVNARGAVFLAEGNPSRLTRLVPC